MADELSWPLAQRRNTIICYATQSVYKGLDVITNKVTPEEQAIAPHHILDFVDPLKNFTVVHFRNMALPIIKDIHNSGKLPIVVGGTHYYIESLLWQVLVDDEKAEVADSKYDAITAQALLQELESWAAFLRHLTRDRFVSLSDKTRQSSAEVFSSIEEYAREAVTYCSQSNSEVAKACEQLASSVPLVKSRIRELLLAARSDLGDFRVDFEMRKIQDEINRKLHDRLRSIDPSTAAALHPNSTRKILR
ncbi:IPP transferase [Nesidiocoris tenuis]|uniref:IPP transferase n=1 Tax=Nesidiocoris tenuis TaxID=355587 RepID=A0ABN7BHD4_9HEMI|nr:IPP transferase [Nesidiocoris tenuis]